MDGERSPWLARYQALYPIRSVGAFHSVSAERVDGAGARVVVVGAPRRDPARIQAALAEAARVHGMLDHPLIPRIGEIGEHEGVPFLELASDATVDGHELMRLLAESGQRLAYGRADAVFTQVREAMQAAHRVVDPVTQRPVCLGRLSLGNVLFSRSGRLWVVGFGHNFPVALESGAPDGTCAVFQAPEVGAGEPPTPGADYISVLLASRGLVTFADVAAITALVVRRGGLDASSRELWKLVRYFDTEWLAQPPWARPSIEDGVRASMRIREILGTTIDAEGLARQVAEILAEHGPAVASPGPEHPRGEVLRLARDGSWVDTPEGKRRLGASHARLLLALVEAHERGAALDVWTLLGHGWPGEEPLPEAGANRVYVALTRLRSVGLRDAIERADGGWRIAPGTRIKRG